MLSTLIQVLLLPLGLLLVEDSSSKAARPEVQVETLELTTRDGATLRGRRYRARAAGADQESVKSQPNGTPVVLFHGLVASLHQFDLDTEKAPALAQFLARRGWDVWAFNFRGGGRGKLRSALPDGQRRWSADELIVEDIPAILEHVRGKNARRPFLVGHSLGGMTTAAYLAGATKISEDDIRLGVAIDRAAAGRRNAEILGAAFLSSPGTLRWTEATSPNALTRLAKFGGEPLRLLLPAQLSVSSLNGTNGGEGRSSSLERAGDRVQSVLDSIFASTNWTTLAFGPKNTRQARGLLKKMRGGVLGDTSEDLLLQLANGARKGVWESYRGPEADRVNYAQHYTNITVPIFVAVGKDDRVADAAISRAVFFDKVSSSRRIFRELVGYGHSDITLADDADRDVFQPLEAWMRQSSASGSAEKEKQAKAGTPVRRD